MKIFTLLAVLIPVLVYPQQSDYPIQPVEFTEVNFNDEFWKPWLELNKTVTIPSSLQKCEETGRIRNFKVAGGLESGEYSGVYPFDDSDLYKVIEGASYSLINSPDPELDAYLDTIISYIAAAQEPDGYLHTWRTIDPNRPPTDWSGIGRWSNINLGHELYDVGHLYEAAVAHYKATGKRTLLDVVIKNADLIVDTFGPGKIVTATGHQEIEIGLAKLYRVTGKKEYLDLAKFFLDRRGKVEDRLNLFGEYSQDHIPITEQTEAVGHAVRAAYMYSAMADIAAISGDTTYVKPLETIWENVVGTKMYLTGGIGARRVGESFGDNYELPNFTAYNETCAAIANIFWNHRMFLMTGDSKYVDVLERTLYNGMIVGVSLSGDKFFYPNPLASDGVDTFNQGSCNRSPWFDCSCCPSNVTRFIPSVPGYVYAVKDEELFVNLFVQNEATIDVGGQQLVISQTTKYPWNGVVEIEVNPKESSQFELKVRIPGWSRNQVLPTDLYNYVDRLDKNPTLSINGESYPFTIENGYASVDRQWRKGDQVLLNLPMAIRQVAAHEQVTENKGKLAIEYGPIVYCAEEVDNQMDIFSIAQLPKTFKRNFNSDQLGGVHQIVGDLSFPTGNDSPEKTTFTMIPYYLWNNRGAGKMSVWFPVK